MNPISTALKSLLNGKIDVCCLCLNEIQEPIQITDSVVININNEECDKVVEEVLNYVFDEGINNYIKMFNTICEQCTKSTISYYKFIQTSQKNVEHFTNVIDGVASSFEYASNEFEDSKSLFVSFNLQDFTSKHYYDIKRPPATRKGALKRFHNLDSDTYECKDCHKEYPTASSLKNHRIRVHAPKIYKCPDCPRTYGSIVYLDEHRNESHCTFVCSHCGKTFYNKHSLTMHELGHNLSLVCQDCGRIYKNKATFKKHKEQYVCEQRTRAHPSEAKFTCDYCNKKYTQKMSLRVHIQYEHGDYKAHVCEWCGKKFWAQSRLKVHIVKHTKERNFPCTICGGKFVSKESLLYHTRTHTGERPYKCTDCDAKFLSASRRTDHVKRHHLGGTFECDICHSKFSSRSFMQKHKRTHMKPNEKSYLSDIPTSTHKPNTTVPNEKTNFTYAKANKVMSNKSVETKNVLTKINLISEASTRDLNWKIDELDDIEIHNFQSVIDAAEIQLEEFSHSDFIEHNTEHSSETGVYLEVSNDSGDFILSGLGT